MRRLLLIRTQSLVLTFCSCSKSVFRQCFKVLTSIIRLNCLQLCCIIEVAKDFYALSSKKLQEFFKVLVSFNYSIFDYNLLFFAKEIIGCFYKRNLLRKLLYKMVNGFGMFYGRDLRAFFILKYEAGSLSLKNKKAEFCGKCAKSVRFYL